MPVKMKIWRDADLELALLGGLSDSKSIARMPAWRATKSRILRVRRTSSVGLPARSPPDSFFCSAEQLIWAEDSCSE